MDNKLIRKAVLVNGLLVVYFLCTNISSFVGIIVSAALFMFAQPYSFLSDKVKINALQHSKGGMCDLQVVHNLYNKFLTAPLGEQVVKLLAIYIVMKISWFIPTWLILLVVGQVYVFREMLEQFAVVQKIENLLKLGKQSIEKAMNLIPKYKQ